MYISTDIPLVSWDTNRLLRRTKCQKGLFMKNSILLLSIFLLTISHASAHSGRTDKNGGHNCSEASKKKGLCTGYHYHNGGGLHLDSTDEIVSLNTENNKSPNVQTQRHRTIESHSEHPQDHMKDSNQDSPSKAAQS